MSNLPIFVPSKNRVNNAKLLQVANEQNHVLTVVIEPQDYNKYLQAFPNLKIIVLPKDNGGITYVRNYIKEFTEQNNITYYWQLDDDITNLYHREGTRMVKDSFNVIKQASELFIGNNIALGGLEYQQFAWSATKEFVKNSFCDVAVFVDNTKTKGLRYRNYVEGKEDRDFAMQVIKSGQQTARTTLFAFSAPSNGSNQGGLKEIFYDIGKESDCVKNMVELWGQNICVPIVKPNGRQDVKILWDKINSTQICLF